MSRADISVAEMRGWISRSPAIVPCPCRDSHAGQSKSLSSQQGRLSPTCAEDEGCCHAPHSRALDKEGKDTGFQAGHHEQLEYVQYRLGFSRVLVADDPAQSPLSRSQRYSGSAGSCGGISAVTERCSVANRAEVCLSFCLNQL